MTTLPMTKQRREVGEGHDILTGNDFTPQVARQLYDRGKSPELVRDRLLAFMAAEVGLELIPMTQLRKFADLVRADQRAEMNAQRHASAGGV